MVILTWFLILSSIQNGDQDGYHCWWRHRPPLPNGMAGRAGLDRRRSLRAKCKSLSKTTWKHHERRQNNSVENACQRSAVSFVSYEQNMISDEEFLLLWEILFEEPKIWTSGFNPRTRVLKSVAEAQERIDMRSGCHAAKILPVGVLGAKNVRCLSSL